MKSDIRAFIAMDIPDELLKNLDQVIMSLKRYIPGTAVRWVPTRNMHLTLKFLGSVPARDLEAIMAELTSAANSYSPIDIEPGSLGAFPSLKRPRVVVFHLKVPPALGQLQKEIDERCRKIGYPVEERSFSPHLTLGRVGRYASPKELQHISLGIESVLVQVTGPRTLGQIHLYRSDLQPSGALYTRLHTSQLSAIIE